MALTVLSTDLYQIIIKYLDMKCASRLSITNTEDKTLVRKYYKATMDRLKCRMDSFKITFPNAIYANISHRINITSDDIQLLSDVKVLDMSLYSHLSLNDYTFKDFSNLKDLNLQGCCKHWNGGHVFTDELFQYITNIERFYIDDNHKITDNGICQLTKVKDLTIRNCSNIGDRGLENLTSLIKLNIYNLYRLTDNAFHNLKYLEFLGMTFCSISDIGISYLINIRKLDFLSCVNIKCKNFDRLVHLNDINLSGVAIVDNDLISLLNIRKICIYGCNIRGNGLKYLINCTHLAIYESPIIDKQLDNLKLLSKIDKICFYRCPMISQEKKRELRTIFGDNFKTDV